MYFLRFIKADISAKITLILKHRSKEDAIQAFLLYPSWLLRGNCTLCSATKTSKYHLLSPWLQHTAKEPWNPAGVQAEASLYLSSLSIAVIWSKSTRLVAPFQFYTAPSCMNRTLSCVSNSYKFSLYFFAYRIKWLQSEPSFPPGDAFQQK